MEQMGQNVAEPGQPRNLICLCGLCCRGLPVGVPHSSLSSPLFHEAILQAPQHQQLLFVRKAIMLLGPPES